MRNSRHKQSLIIVIFIFLIGGLWLGVNYIAPRLIHPPQVDANKLPPPPSVVKLASEWPQIMQHVASPPRGGDKVPYSIVEFGDFQCPQCGKMRPGLENFLRASKGKTNLYFVQRPIPEQHQWANESAQAAAVAADYHKFWPMYDILYNNQDDLEPGFYGDYAAKIGIDKAVFTKSFNDPKYAKQILESYNFCNSIGMDLTPSILVHDNKTGTVSIYRGKAEIVQFFNNPPWAGPTSNVVGNKPS